MRILVHGLVGTNIGGIETFLLNINENMSSNCIFDYVIEEDECIHQALIKKKGGDVYRISPRNIQPIKHIIEVFRLYKNSRKRYQTIYYNLSSASWIIPILIGKMLGYRVVVHSHNADFIDKNGSTFYRLINKINRNILSRINIERLACSPMASEFLFGNRDAVCVNNGIDVKKFSFSENIRNDVRKKLGIGHELVLGTVGRLAYQKNPLFTLEIFKELSLKAPDSKLLMVGEGNMREAVEKYIRDNNLTDRVILTGNVHTVNEILNAMDIFVLPSRHEGLGIALIEAQANGLHAFTSKEKVPIEVCVTPLVTMVALEDGASLWADLIFKKLSSPRDGREIWNNEVARSGYSIESCANELERILMGFQ